MSSYKKNDPDRLKDVRETTDLAWLAKIIAAEQSDYWYDPCGKSGQELNRRLTDVSAAAVARAYELMGMGKLEWHRGS